MRGEIMPKYQWQAARNHQRGVTEVIEYRSGENAWR
jgi:hypothetical protein